MFRGKFLLAALTVILLFGLFAVQTKCAAAQTPPKAEEPGKAQEPKDSKKDELKHYFTEGLEAMEHKNWEFAIEDFKKAAKLKPDSYNIWMYLARCYGESHKSVDAIAALDEAIKIKPTVAGAYLAIMDNYWDLDLLTEIVKTADKALANGVKPELILPDLGWYYYLAGDNANAEASYNKAMKANPKDSRTVNDIGVLLFSEGKYGEALDKFKEAQALNPGSQIVPYLEALSYNKLGKEDDALNALKEGIKKDSGLEGEVPQFNKDLFPRTDPGDLSKLFAKLKPASPVLKNISGTAPALKNLSVTAPVKK
ncbi:MAG: tetratricopeptide repeat protein [Nitrospirota bacterium]